MVCELCTCDCCLQYGDMYNISQLAFKKALDDCEQEEGEQDEENINEVMS